jgi:hypothetical protein
MLVDEGGLGLAAPRANEPTTSQNDKLSTVQVRGLALDSPVLSRMMIIASSPMVLSSYIFMRRHFFGSFSYWSLLALGLVIRFGVGLPKSKPVLLLCYTRVPVKRIPRAAQLSYISC